MGHVQASMKKLDNLDTVDTNGLWRWQGMRKGNTRLEATRAAQENGSA
jgi:hypothetical protein